jgi:urea transport system substrate-binding protein
MTSEDFVGLSQTAKPKRTPAPALVESLPPGDTTMDPPNARPPVSPEQRVGTTTGKYLVTGMLGQGAMGVVYKGRDPLIERDVAIKVIAADLANDPVALARFVAEAKAAGKLNHPNVMAIYEIRQDDLGTSLILEYVAGGSLADRLRECGCLSVLEATRALIDACQGVSAAHAAGLIHRDLKPANLMRSVDGGIKVADFGLAKTVDSAGHCTQSGAIVGTPTFMSPEQCEARPADPRSDIYALGATYYCLLTGLRPFHDATTVPQIMYAHCHKPIPDPRCVDVKIPEACARIIARAMAKAPADRYQSAGEMVADLQTVLAGLSGQTPPLGEAREPSNSALTLGVHAVPPREWRVPAFAAGAMLIVTIALAIIFSGRDRHGYTAAEPNGGAAAPSGEPIPIGVLHSLSGTMESSESQMVEAVLFAIDELNRSGGVLGRPVQAVVADGRSDSAVFAQEAERLITREKVATVFGCWTSASRKTVKPIFEAHDHLLIYPLQIEGLETSPCIVYLGAAPNQQILPAVAWAVNTLGKKTFFLVGSDCVCPHASHAIIKDYMERIGGAVVGEEYMPLGSQRVDAVIAAIVKAKPDMILNSINGDTNIGFFRGLRAAGVTPASTPTLSFAVDEQGLRSLNPADLKGDYAAWNYFQSLATPENAEFVRRFEKKYPQRIITDPMETAYVGVKLWAQAVHEAESLEPKKIRRAFANQRLMAPSGEVRVDPDTQYCFRTPRIGQIQADGRFDVVWTAPAPVRPEPYPATRTAEAWHAFLHDLRTGWGNRWAAPEDDLSTPKR